jgi:hypothetical protein
MSSRRAPQDLLDTHGPFRGHFNGYIGMDLTRNVGAAGDAPGATFCRVLPSDSSYLSMTYDLRGALAVSGSGVRAASAPPKS